MNAWKTARVGKTTFGVVKGQVGISRSGKTIGLSTHGGMKKAPHMSLTVGSTTAHSVNHSHIGTAVGIGAAAGVTHAVRGSRSENKHPRAG